MSEPLLINGYQFERLEDGSVFVRATAPSVCYTPHEWAKVVAHVTERGAEAEGDALTLHTMPDADHELTVGELARSIRRANPIVVPKPTTTLVEEGP